MRKYVLVAVVVMLVTVVASAYHNEEPGFRGHQWGMPVPKDWGEPARTDSSLGGIDLYRVPDEDQKLGCANLQRLEYGFWQGRLSDVRIRFDGYDNYKCVLDLLKEKYGEGVRPKESTQYYVWLGGVTTIVLRYDEREKEGSLTLLSKGISNEQQEWERAQAKKRAGGL